jgi:hypothetical protein
MRAGRRFFWAIAGVAVGAGLLGAVAVAAPNGNSSSVDFDATPSTLPRDNYENARITIRAHTDYGGDTVTQKTKRIEFSIDNDFKFDPSAKPKCDGYLPGTMEQVMDHCGDSKVGWGNVVAVDGNGRESRGCILPFNGERDDVGRPTILFYIRLFTDDCSDPAHNTSGLLTVVAIGTLKDGDGDFGKVLDVKPLDGWAVAYIDFRPTINGGAYFQARCHDDARTQNLRAVFTYRDNQSDTATASEPCAVG